MTTPLVSGSPLTNTHSSLIGGPLCAKNCNCSECSNTRRSSSDGSKFRASTVYVTYRDDQFEATVFETASGHIKAYTQLFSCERLSKLIAEKPSETPDCLAEAQKLISTLVELHAGSQSVHPLNSAPNLYKEDALDTLLELPGLI